MNFEQFLEYVIDDGIVAAMKDYGKGSRYDGAIDGFEACRNKLNELPKILAKAKEACKTAGWCICLRITTEGISTTETPDGDDGDYWYYRCFYAEVEWVVNVVSALSVSIGNPSLADNFPTARGMMKATEILKTHLL